LRSAPANQRQQAADALGLLAAPDALAGLGAALHDGERRVRLAVVRNLARFADPAAFGFLVIATGDADEEVRRMALTHVAESTDPRAVEILVAALDTPGEPLRLTLVKLLAQRPEDRVTAALAQLLADSSPRVRRQAALALVQRQDLRGARALLNGDPEMNETIDDRMEAVERVVALVPTAPDAIQAEVVTLLLDYLRRHRVRVHSADFGTQTRILYGKVAQALAVLYHARRLTPASRQAILHDAAVVEKSVHVDQGTGTHVDQAIDRGERHQDTWSGHSDEFTWERLV
jgi:hypothetical protein